MKYIYIPVFMLVTLLSCKKKDTYGYSCVCTDKTSGQTDTTFTLRVQTSGEASYICKEHADTANAYGSNIGCNIK